MISQKQRDMARILKEVGYTHAAIAREIRCHPNSVAKILAQEESAMPQKSSKLDPFVDYLKKRLKEYPDLQGVVLLEEIQDQGYTGKISILRDLLKEIRPYQPKEPIVRYETPPGEQFQVDFGQGTTKIQGQPVIVKFFCMIMSYSRHFFVLPVPNEKLATLIDAHNQAFEFFGGYAAQGLYDNMKTVVEALKREKVFNKKFMDFADYYGFKVLTHRPYRPQTKGKVERVVPYYRSRCLYGQEYWNWSHLLQSTGQWLVKASRRLHSELKEVPWERFQQEQPLLLPLNGTYPLRRLETRKVTKKGGVVFENRLYPIGTQYTGNIINMERENSKLCFYLKDQLIHTCMYQGPQVQQADLQLYEDAIS